MQYEPNLAGTRHVKYTRADGLRDGALIPVQTYLFDTKGSWERGCETNEFQSIKSLDDNTHIGAAIKTSLETSACEQILKASLQKFDDLNRVYTRAKCLVVTKDIAAAQRIHRLINNLNRQVEIATSADLKNAKVATKNFRYGGSEILVTCQMCYEGLDCKAINVVCLLTHIRSKPWIEQAVARGTRFDPEGPADQQCHLFTLDDKKMQRVLERLKNEDIQAARDQEEQVDGSGGGGKNYEFVTPLTSLVQGFKWTDLDSGSDLSARALKQSLKDVVGADITAEQASELSERLRSAQQESVRPPTPAEITDRLRKGIHKETNKKAYSYGIDPSEFNAWVKLNLQRGKPRNELTNPELTALLSDIQALNSSSPILM